MKNEDGTEIYGKDTALAWPFEKNSSVTLASAERSFHVIIRFLIQQFYIISLVSYQIGENV